MERRSLTFTEFSLFVPLLHLLFTVLSAPIVSAVPRNVTIDDQGGDPETGEIPKYQPTDAWANQACGGCRVVPDPERLYNRTATAATFMPDRNVTNNTIDFSFTGTAIYIFFTLFENEGDQITVNTECNFTIDGSYAGYFNHQGDPSKPFRSGQQYGVPVFSMRGLEQKNHSMTIYMADVDYHTFLSFDYATYTTDQELIVDPLRTSSRWVTPLPLVYCINHLIQDRSSSDVSRIARLSGTPSTASSTPSTGTRSHTPSVSGDTPTTTSNIPSMVTQNHPPVISVGAIAGSVVGGVLSGIELSDHHLYHAISLTYTEEALTKKPSEKSSLILAMVITHTLPNRQIPNLRLPRPVGQEHQQTPRATILERLRSAGQGQLINEFVVFMRK
ncbi:hypothetical protein NP233_g113 [Leucocoprinus birnbaumii]|uniref:Uncharacterized protein n=1 Tax=Leucocoprinus birnbaumii TaxID=56174 RepID=A0AAD5YWZ3_9AGAR|nr:hypothetical protein NP233_g113 [Leucocoprinus birnbaumii]